MDIKLVILLAVAIAIIFLLMNEMSALREEIDKKMSELNNRITKYNDDTRVVFKKETSEMTAKFKTYMADTIKELRTMNHIENQIITHMSDQFAEADSFDRPGMPYLSDVNPNSRYKKSTVNINPAQKVESDTVVINTRTHNATHSNRKSIDDELYMSPKSDDFKVKENGKALLSMTDTEAEDVEDVEDVENTEPVEDAEDGEDGEDGEDAEDAEDGENEEDAEDAEDLDPVVDAEQAGKAKTESSKPDTSKPSTSKADAKTKLETYRKIRASMEDDEDTVSSENITFGSTNKGVQITVKGIKTKKSDDGETDDSHNESESHDETDITAASNADAFRLKSISRYSKQDLVDIAREKGIMVTERSNKTDIYNTIRNSL